MDLREQFEKRILGIQKYFKDETNLKYNSDCDCYEDSRLNTLYTFFKFGAKSQLDSIVITLPKEYGITALSSRDAAIRDCAKIIESQGIKVKKHE